MRSATASRRAHQVYPNTSLAINTPVPAPLAPTRHLARPLYLERHALRQRRALLPFQPLVPLTSRDRARAPLSINSRRPRNAARGGLLKQSARPLKATALFNFVGSTFLQLPRGSITGPHLSRTGLWSGFQPRNRPPSARKRPILPIGC